MRKNKDVVVYRREGGRKLFLVACQLRHVVGAMSQLTGILEKAKFTIITGFVASADEDGYGRCSYFVEATEGRPQAQELKALLEDSQYLKDVDVKEARNGLLVDSLNFPLSWNSGDRAIMLRTHFFRVMEEGARRLLATGADVLLYEMGYDHGKPTWDDLLSNYRVREKEDLQEIISLYSAAGWGITEVASLNLASKKAVVRVRNNFECEAGTGKAQLGSNFVRGHLAGLFSSLFGARAKVAETKCVSQGDPACEFSVST